MDFKNELGAILWRGPSPVDGSPIVAIATGFTKKGSMNSKTGKMLQTFILCETDHPGNTFQDGRDKAICGNCIHRRDQETGIRTCYVRMDGPAAVWRAFKAGRYLDLSDDLETAAAWVEETDRPVRLGAYGDPAMVPFHVWEVITGAAPAWTGYTHQWAEPWFDSRMLSLVMASTEGQAGPKVARTFRVMEKGESLRKNEVMCPSTTKGVKCADCKLCKGTSLKAKNVAIPVHGRGKKNFVSLKVVA